MKKLTQKCSQWLLTAFLLAGLQFNSNAQTATHLNFDGANDYVDCGTILPASYTKEAWIRISNLGAINNIISGGASDGSHAFWAHTGYGNRLSSGHNLVWDQVQDPTPLLANIWYHVAVTYDAATTTMRLYKNGVLVSTNTSVPPFTIGNKVRLGAYGDASYVFQGDMDEVRIWDFARSQAAINASMNSELVGNESGLTAYYKFNQGIAAGNNTAITTLTNATANPFNGSIINFALTGATSNFLDGSPALPPTPATHLHFDGTNDFVRCGTAFNAAFSSQNTVTMEAWVRSETTTGNGVVAGNFSGADNNIYMQFFIRRDGANYVFWILNSTNTAYVNVTAANAVAVNTWQHVVGVRNGDQLLIYINGVLVNTTAGVGTHNFTANTGNEFTIGGNARPFSEFFRGDIDEVRVWTTALSAAEIARRKNCELQGNEAGLYAYYKFNQGDAAGTNTAVTTLTNSSATVGLNGTLTNMALTGTTSNWVGSSPVITGSTLPSAPSANAQIFSCGSTVANLIPAPSATINWYNVATGGTALASTTALATATYYVAAVNANGCESGRTSVSVTAPPFLGLNATITKSPDCSTTGTIQVVQQSLLNTDFSAQPAGSTLTGNASITGGQCVLTNNTPSQQGTITFAPTAFTPATIEVGFSFLTGGGTGADGFSFNYGVIPANPSGSEYGVATSGLVIRFIEYGTSRVELVYNGAVLSSVPFTLSTNTFWGCNFRVRENGTITLSIGGTPVFNNITIPGYLAHDKSNWKFAFSGRTGASTNNHIIDNVNITTPLPDLFSIDGTTWQGPFFNSVISGTYTVRGRYASQTCSEVLGVVTVRVAPILNTTAPSSQTVCANSPVAPMIFTTDITGATVNWTNSYPPIGLPASGTGNVPGFTATNFNPSPIFATIQVVASHNGCTSSPLGRSIIVNSPYTNSIAFGTLQQTINISSSVYFSLNCGPLIAAVIPIGGTPISGSTTAKVWIEGTQNPQFVKRHYEITPATNAATATGRVTLYFTQAEFNDFNAVNTIDLPTGSADATGKANLLIEKRSGVSTDGSGLPSTYTGSVITIDPVDADIVWNVTANRWEVSFDVTGFSGFFLKTQAAALPVSLINFTATKQVNDNVLLQWLTANEINFNRFELQRSTNGSSFENIGIVTALNTGANNNYQLYDNAVWTSDVRYYRLKMIDNDGKFKYSIVVRISNKENNGSLSVYPNPVIDVFTLQVADNKLLYTTAQLVDVSGKLIKLISIKNPFQTVHIGSVPKGIYLLKLEDGSVIKIIKE